MDFSGVSNFVELVIGSAFGLVLASFIVERVEAITAHIKNKIHQRADRKRYQKK